MVHSMIREGYGVSILGSEGETLTLTISHNAHHNLCTLPRSANNVVANLYSAIVAFVCYLHPLWKFDSRITEVAL